MGTLERLLEDSQAEQGHSITPTEPMVVATSIQNEDGTKRRGVEQPERDRERDTVPMSFFMNALKEMQMNTNAQMLQMSEAVKAATAAAMAASAAAQAASSRHQMEQAVPPAGGRGDALPREQKSGADHREDGGQAEDFELEPLTKLPKAVIKHIDKVAKNFTKTVEKRWRAEQALEKAMQDVAVMSEKGGVRYPSGVRPWRGPAEFLELDQQLEEAKLQDYEVRVVLPRGISRRDAARQLHQAAAKEIRKIFGEAHAEQVHNMKPQTSKTWFLDECNSYDGMAKDDEFNEPDDLEEPLRKAINSKQAREYAETSYRKAVDGVRHKRSEMAKQKKTQEELREQRRKELEDARAPVVFGDIVRTMVKNNIDLVMNGDPIDEDDMNCDEDGDKQQLPREGASPQKGPEEEEEELEQKFEKLTNAMNTKNGGSPGGGPGKQEKAAANSTTGSTSSRGVVNRSWEASSSTWRPHEHLQKWAQNRGGHQGGHHQDHRGAWPKSGSAGRRGGWQ